MSAAGVTRARDDGLVHINHTQLMRKLRLRGKTPASLRSAGVSFDTLNKIRQGQPVQTRILRKITVLLAEWPELEHAEELIEKAAV